MVSKSTPEKYVTPAPSVPLDPGSPSANESAGTPDAIRLRGVRVHNLRDINVDIPRHQLVVLCGVSGSGKTSLALDTLYAEGQRRYIESFSAYTRQFLQRLDKPDCESIDGLPPAIAVTRSTGFRGNRTTVATTTEIADYLRLLYARIASLHCYRCGATIARHSPDSLATMLQRLPQGTRCMVAFPIEFSGRVDANDTLAWLQQQGFLRVRIGAQTFHLAESERPALAAAIAPRKTTHAAVIVDRLTIGDDTARLMDSLETAFAEGEGRVVLSIDATAAPAVSPHDLTLPDNFATPGHRDSCLQEIDGKLWIDLTLSRSRSCNRCQIDYPDAEPRLFNFNQPLGACTQCEGFGDVMQNDMALIVPDANKSIAEGAIAPWNTPSFRHELDELLAIAPKHKLRTDVPFSQLTPVELALIEQGSPEDDFGGLRGFFAWLERKKYKMHVRVFLSRWRSYYRCPDCQGQRLRPEVLAYKLAGHSFADFLAFSVDYASTFINSLNLDSQQTTIASDILKQLRNRLGFLKTVGLGHLQLDRPLRTLSGGESQRVALTSTLGSNLVNMLYVLDEPTAGLHPHDVERLSDAILALRDRGNTVVCVEHEEAILRRADHLIEIGPGAGTQGGRVVFSGSLATMQQTPQSLTGDFLAGRRGQLDAKPQRRKPRGRIDLLGATGHNLQIERVSFPLGLLCLITGVSGSGKSSLVTQTLYGAILKRKRKDKIPVDTLPYVDCIGDGQIDDVVLIDQSPISRSPRSNPVTFLKAFDPIRELFADTVDARTRGMSSGHFSFNSELGRCEVCEGDGVQTIDMQFLADVSMQCPACKGTRYRPEILQIRYRDRSIADVLEMTVRQGMAFFRGQEKVIKKLQCLIDVGLDYVGLGQAATTLSSGEAQRLKLAAFLASASRRRNLFILDEPTTGLHFADIMQLVECFNALIDAGHSLLVIEHNVQLMRAADYIIDLGPGAASEGGRIVAEGTPEQLLDSPQSKTALALKLNRSGHR